MIYTVTFNPSLDYVVHMKKFTAGDINRAEQEMIYPGGKGINVSLVLGNLHIPSKMLALWPALRVRKSNGWQKPTAEIRILSSSMKAARVLTSRSALTMKRLSTAWARISRKNKLNCPLGQNRPPFRRRYLGLGRQYPQRYSRRYL